MSRNRAEEDKSEILSLPKSFIFTILGIVGIVYGSNLVVDSATKIATILGVSERIIALTIIALGTSLPELVTSLTATKKGEYDPKLGGIDWAWKAKFGADKVRSTGFKSCLFKYKNNKGGIQAVDGKLDFLDSKYKEKHNDKKYDFEKFTSGIAEEVEPKKKSKSWRQNTNFEQDENGDIDPISTNSTGAILFDNEDAVVIDLKHNKK